MKHLNKIGFRDLKQAIIFDIETASIEPELKEGTPLLESWTYKMRNESDITSFEELNDSFKKKAPLYPAFARVVSISMGYAQDNVLKVKEYKNGDEKALIQEFFNDLGVLVRSGKSHLVSYAGIGYDIPLVSFRAMVLGIPLHPMFDVAHQKEWNLDYCIDLNLYLRGTAFASMSLLNAAVAFGLPSPKQALSGDEVSELYWSKDKKRLDKIAAYCTQDVLTTANLFCKILGRDILELEVSH